MPIIRNALSELLTFDISIGPGPIGQALDIDWEFSVSNELTFNEPGENGFADGGFSWSTDVAFESNSIARDILVSDSFDFSLEKRGGILKGEDGFNVEMTNTYVDAFDSWRGTSAETLNETSFGIDGDDRDVDFSVIAARETSLFDRDILPDFAFDFAIF